ncbi:MAG: hypothetical protein LBQ69_04735 [Treponema sp.]|nr:hypothetical protein [Treponema sp.]
MNLLIQVAKSWQVLAMTAALVLYMALVNYVARTYRQPRFVSKSMPRKSRPKAPRKAKSDGPVVTKDGDSNEALGLEEK